MIKETSESMKAIHQRLLEAQKRTTEQVKVIRQRLLTAQNWGSSVSLGLATEAFRVHDVFHVSMLRKYKPDPSHVLEWSELELEADASYGEEPIRTLDSRDQVLRGKTIPLVRVLWSNQGKEESTWEREDEIREKSGHCFEVYCWSVKTVYRAEISRRNP
ncbi:uncharacterized protein LOC131302965 [Rhododendron vialii]|uniref:uncharacterized protein LOC131302965 n=1 Tax=Rhododendron vialii TaxID=182163 RepID=UPI00265FA133|nr:uncharacterized protein LOC131302965 [Rhododendron vialii]